MFPNPSNRYLDCCCTQSNGEFTSKIQLKVDSDLCVLRKYNSDNKEDKYKRYNKGDSYEFKPRDMYQSKRSRSQIVTDYNTDFCNFDEGLNYENVNRQRTIKNYEDICRSLKKSDFGERSYHENNKRKLNHNKNDQPPCRCCICKTCPFCFLRIFCVEVLKELAEIKARQFCSDLEKLYYAPQAYEGEPFRRSEGSFNGRRRPIDSADRRKNQPSELSVDNTKDRRRRRDPDQKDDSGKSRNKRKSRVDDTKETRESRHKTKNRRSDLSGDSPQAKSRDRRQESIADNIDGGQKSLGRMRKSIVDGGGDGQYIDEKERKSRLAKELEIQGLSPEEIEKQLQRVSSITEGGKELVNPQTQLNISSVLAEKKKKQEEQAKKDLAAKRISQATQMANKHWTVKPYTGPGRFAEITICDFMKLRLESIIEREMAVKSAGRFPPCPPLLVRPCMPVVCTISPQYCCPSFWCPPSTVSAISC